MVTSRSLCSFYVFFFFLLMALFIRNMSQCYSSQGYHFCFNNFFFELNVKLIRKQKKNVLYKVSWFGFSKEIKTYCFNKINRQPTTLSYCSKYWLPCGKPEPESVLVFSDLPRKVKRFFFWHSYQLYKLAVSKELQLRHGDSCSSLAIFDIA